MSGFRLAVKDNIDVAGLPTTAGLQAWRDRIAQRDAPVVSALKKHGAIVIGKTLMDEAAFGALGDNPWYGRVHNPARHGYTCGGSSAGSAAAVASGEADLALGTDTLGSVRIPASYCGVVGYVPSAGRIDMTGVTPLAPSFDRVGLFTRTVQEMAALRRHAGRSGVRRRHAVRSASSPRDANSAQAAERLWRAGCALGPHRRASTGARCAARCCCRSKSKPRLRCSPCLPFGAAARGAGVRQERRLPKSLPAHGT